LEDCRLSAAPWSVDAHRDRVQISTRDDGLDNVDDVFEPEQVNLARVVVTQRHRILTTHVGSLPQPDDLLALRK